ncbi:MAG TPA: class I SAM-dependent methyltransferase [Candidatus Binataceae bacterium]|nr:class I SAM-dependent methyltransferase [Candidatus Binataceae bacterium]
MGVKRWIDIFRRAQRRGETYPAELAFLLDTPLRALVQFSPATLADRLNLTSNWTVLELGPGPGYFSAEVARRLSSGRLVLCDLQPAMLLRARAKLARREIHNPDYICADATALPLGNHAVDAAFLVTVLGEVSRPLDCLRELARVLKPQGRLSISEARNDPDFITIDELTLMAAQAGFKFIERFGSERNFTANFRGAQGREPN